MRNVLLAAILIMSFANMAVVVWKPRHVKPLPLKRPVAQAQQEGSSSKLPLPAQPQKPPERVPEFVSVPVYRQVGEQGSVYADVLSHSQSAPFGDGSGRSTNAHETAHGIHSELRNAYTSQRGHKVNGFYCLQGRGVIVDEPRIRKSAVNGFVPQNLRSYRWGTYFQGQGDWDDTPTYICDEWAAYVIGGMCCVDDVQHNRHRGGWTDGVSGCLDFSIYTMALCMAIKQGDPEYWRTNTQFKNFVIWMQKRANETYLKGHRMSQFKWDKQDNLLAEFLTSQAAAPMRKFVKEELDGVWLDAKTANVAGPTSYRLYQRRATGNFDLKACINLD